MSIFNRLIAIGILTLWAFPGEIQATDSLQTTAVPDSALTATPDTASVLSAVAAVNAPVMEEEAPGYFEKLTSDGYFPFVLITLCVLLIVWFAYDSVFQSVRKLRQTLSEDARLSEFETKDVLEQSRATRGALKYIFFILLFGYLLYVGVKGTSSQGYVMEWLNLIVRWAHVVAGVMWIGASFYFIFLENHLNRTDGVRDELAGNLWAIHGGGFYFLEKYKVAPGVIPKKLHWFKYEAYFTWLSGFSLLFIVYYMDAKAYLIDPEVANISTAAGIGIGVGTLVVGWIIYDLMCKSALIKRQQLFAWVGLAVIAVISYFLTHTLSSRAAFIHVGALLGTIMAGNVYFVIIPSQKALVKAAVTGQPLDATLGKKAGQRSLHNNYITLPVIFIMISNHYPSTFGHEYNWIILLVISIASAGIKHYWNLIERGVAKTYILVVSVLLLFGVAIVSSPAFEETMDAATPVPFSEVNAIMQLRCVQCHSANPTDDQWKSAPNGVMYDTPDQIRNMADKIMIRAVRSNSMPQGNKTGMTTEERQILKRWILQGAKTTE